MPAKSAEKKAAAPSKADDAERHAARVEKRVRNLEARVDTIVARLNSSLGIVIEPVEEAEE
jgi:hypothetical protein